jgi:CubicO group peptidase (beta-lactamase class C family)
MGEAIFKKVPKRGCVVVIKDGAIVYEKYESVEYNTTAHVGFSQTKTLGALIMGWLQSRSKIDIDADITEKYNVKSPRPYPVTSRQIMSQALDGETGPGQKWAYDTIGTRWINHLQPVVKATGNTPSTIWEEGFQKPLGMSDAFSWKDVDKDWSKGSFGTCRDYARVGQLMLNKGAWKGMNESIVSADYITQMTTPETRYAPYPTYSNPCYGLLTWLNTNPGSDRGSLKYPGTCKDWPESTWFPAGSPNSVYLLAGFLGQETMVIPTHDMVVVSMGDTADDYPLEKAMYEGVCTLFPGECVASPEQ